MKNCPIECDILELMGKEEIDFDRKKVLVSMGKFTSVKWEHYAYIKGGGALGEEAGKITEFTLQQMQKVDEMATSFLGSDLGILEPLNYSSLFCTELQNKLKWNKESMMWATNEDAINTKDRDYKIN